MTKQQSLDQVAGILHRAELKFEESADRAGFRLLFEDAAIFVVADHFGDDVMLTVTSPILSGIERDTPGYALVLNRLNDLNRRHRFLKFMVIRDSLVAAADLRADDLAAGELLNVVRLMATAANRTARKLAKRTGGRTYRQVLIEQMAADADDDIPF